MVEDSNAPLMAVTELLKEGVRWLADARFRAGETG